MFRYASYHITTTIRSAKIVVITDTMVTTIKMKFKSEFSHVACPFFLYYIDPLGPFGNFIYKIKYSKASN